MPRAAAAVLALLLTPACTIVYQQVGPMDGSTGDDGPSSWPTVPESSDSSSTGEPIEEDTTGAGDTSTGEGTVDTTGSTGLDSSSGAETTGDDDTSTGDGSSSSSTGVVVDDCGDGIVQPGEACDNGAENNHDENACTSACKLNLGLVCSEDSECASEVCVSSGFEPDVRRCSIACKPTVAAECYNPPVSAKLSP